MSQIQIESCRHDHPDKKETLVKHDEKGLLPLVKLCPDCISSLESSYFFKIISIDGIKQASHTKEKQN